MTEDLDASDLPDDWASALREHGCDLSMLSALVADVYKPCESTKVRPLRQDVFRSFHLTPLNEVRVVILGQDPYPSPSEAHGLAFSVPNPLPAPRSLRTIYRNLEKRPSHAVQPARVWRPDPLGKQRCPPPQHRADSRAGRSWLARSPMGRLHRQRPQGDHRPAPTCRIPSLGFARHPQGGIGFDRRATAQGDPLRPPRSARQNQGTPVQGRLALR